MTPAKEYENRADEARSQAERSFRSSDKEAWLPIAEEWIKLAQRATNQLTAGSVRALSDRLATDAQERAAQAVDTSVLATFKERAEDWRARLEQAEQRAK